MLMPKVCFVRLSKITESAFGSLLCCGFMLLPAQLLAAEPFRAPRPTPVPQLAFDVQWRNPPYQGELNDAKRRVTQAAVATPDVELAIYGPCKEADNGGLEVYGNPGSTFPMNVWTGECMSPVAVTLRSSKYYLDLTGPAMIRWITRAANMHAVRPVLLLADGTLIVGDHVDVTRTALGQLEPQMVESEFAIAPLQWYQLNPQTIAVMKSVSNPDLARVQAIGFADLMPGGGHGPAGWINVGEIQVYGKRVPR